MNQNWPIPSVLLGNRPSPYSMGVPVGPQGAAQAPMMPPQSQPVPAPQMAPPAPAPAPQGGGLLSGMGQPGGLLARANEWMTPERGDMLMGLGMGLSQLAYNQPVDMSPAFQSMERRRQTADLRKAMDAPGIMDRFSPQQRAVLAMMPEPLALEIISKEAFRQPEVATPMSPLGKLEADFRAGMISPEVYEAEMAKQYAGGGQHDLITGDRAASMGLDPRNAYNMGPDGRIYQIGGGGTTVNIGSGEVGTIPPGFELFTDPETGARSMRPIPGGPVAMQQEQDARAQDRGREVTQVAAQTVFEDASRALDVIDRLGSMAAGPGSLLSAIPATGARELRGHIDSIKGNIGIDQLLKIKASGAGLGAIPQAQLEMLAGLLGNLDSAQDADSLRFNLQRVQEIYAQIVEAEGGNPIQMYQDRRDRFGGQQQQGAATGAPRAGDIVDGWRYVGGDPGSPSSWERAE